MTVTWHPGPPPGRGDYWLCIEGGKPRAAFVDIVGMDASWVLMLGSAYIVAIEHRRITHHALMTRPEAP
jgi:hypothetical protein